ARTVSGVSSVHTDRHHRIHVPTSRAGAPEPGHAAASRRDRAANPTTWPHGVSGLTRPHRAGSEVADRHVARDIARDWTFPGRSAGIDRCTLWAGYRWRRWCSWGAVVRGGVFINYRGEDSHSYGALLHAELSRRFGPESVFLDAESIPAGADY